MTEATIQNNLDDVCTAQTLTEENPKLFTESQLNWLIKTRQKNGLAETGAILKISRKIYINKPKFFDWFLHQKAA